MENEIMQYVRLLRRWLWLIIVAAFVGGSIGFIYQNSQLPRYRAQTTLAIGNLLQSSNPELSDMRVAFDLPQTYAQLVETYNVLQGVVDELNLTMEPEAVRNLILTNIVTGTTLLRISVTFTDPVMAADIANSVANQLILASPSNLTPEQQARVDFINDQLDVQIAELNSLRSQLNETDQNLALPAISDDARQFLRDQRNTLITQINQANSNIADFTRTLTDLQQRTNSIEIVEEARVPTSRVGISLMVTVAIGIAVGALLSVSGVFLYEYLNDTFRSADELTNYLHVPVLGVISRFGRRVAAYSERLIVNMPNFSRTTEEYRTLRTNLLFAGSGDGDKRVFVVSSASPSEGKSVTTANLAVSIALSGLKVLLVDADLRRPRAHEAFEVDNQLGLSSLLMKQAQEEETEDGENILESWHEFIHKTSVPNLYVLPSGYSPQNPSELLGSVLMKRWYKELMKSQLDVILFDSPPVLAVSDSAVLAASINANVVLVVQANGTRRQAAQKAKERFQQVGLDIVGVVLNGANTRDESYYGYGYYGYYYSSDGTASGSNKAAEATSGSSKKSS